VYGHPGLNKIRINNPPNADKPGIYKIEVYAVNNNFERLANTEVVPVIVVHDKYAAQRADAYAPRLSQALFDKRAIDLEVNFNDGTGWYRLKLASTDKGEKRIDCRHTSYYEYDKQKFHIYFKAPSGAQDEYSNKYAEGHDVFGGGREEVQCYIRTVAEPRYRDTFWMKKQFGDCGFTGNLNYITTGTGIQDFIAYWINTDISDASNIDGSLTNYGGHDGAAFGGGLQLKSKDIFDYFFSPLEMRKYDIKVGLEEQLPSRFIYELDAPTFKTVAGEKSISLSEFDSMYADWYEIYCKTILDPNAPAVGVNENPLSWTPYGSVYQNNDQDYAVTLNNLPPNRNYALVVVGRNEDGEVSGTSKPVYYDGLKGSTKYTDAQKLWVYEDIPPSSPPTVGGIYMSPYNHRTIQVDNVSLPGEVRYQIWWKLSGEQWSQASYYDTYSDKNSLEYGPVSYTITNHGGKPLTYWQTYDVRVRAGTLGDKWGPFSPAAQVTIGSSSGFNFDFYWGSGYQVNNGYWWNYYDLYLNCISVPEGTVRYRVTGTIVLSGAAGWWVGNIYPYYISFDKYVYPDSSLVYLGTPFYTAGGFLTDYQTTWIGVSFTITFYNDNGDAVTQSYYVDTSQGTLALF
jgi:hypothetical protein